jgi:hypothetical protein
VPISDLAPSFASQGWGALGTDRSVMGRPLVIAGRRFARGLGTHAASEVAYDLEGPYTAFEAWVGVDDEMLRYPQASVVFRVLGDGRTLFSSGIMRPKMPAVRVQVPLRGVRQLRLVVTDAGDGIDADHADWADAYLVGRPNVPALPPPGPARYSVTAPGITLRFGADGRVAGASVRGSDAHLRDASTYLGGCAEVGKGRARRYGRGGLEVTRRFRAPQKRGEATLTERFTPTRTSVRWEVAIRSGGAPWSAPITTRLACKPAAGTRMWAAWSDSDQRGDRWHDPLETRPFTTRLWGYGGNASQDFFFALPLASVVDAAHDSALSLVLSPEDTLLDLSLTTSRTGTLAFSRTSYRLGGGRSLRFAMDLVPHAADPRAALGWMVERYPRFFDPPNPRASQIAGCGAYSSFEGNLDAAKLKRIGFCVNWKASYDFPYMGMFLPPVPGEGDRWNRFDVAPGWTPKAGPFTTTSRRQLEGYARSMRGQGFHVLSYFNTTEFGTAIGGPDKVDSTLRPGEEWRDATTFLYRRIPDGILRTPQGGAYGTWGGAVAMDPGGPSFRSHLLDQARKHVLKLPDSDGICIDRLDWLAFYNPRGNDGVSWRDDRPARSLLLSWHRLMSEMGPIFHRADKVIFANTLVSRLELLRQVDGIYDEMGSRPPRQNAVALLGLRKPAIVWTSDEGVLKPDPDAYFQRHLYLGLFPTAPLPGNDHTILPSPWADEQYLRYGPLLDCLRGRTWVLEPHPVSVAGAKANVFLVPSGYVIPVVLAGKATSATLTLRHLPGLAGAKYEALLPGATKWRPVRAATVSGGMRLVMPLSRGCAVVRIQRKGTAG